MQFEFTYTAEQEKFRKEVRDWLDINIPMDFDISGNPHDTVPGGAKYAFIREARRKLGEKGWLAPTWPKEYGGGGLSTDEAVIIDEEIAVRPWVRFGIGDFYTGVLNTFAPQVYTVGTEEQKRQFLPPILKGELLGWQHYTEPDCGSDIAGVKTTAIRDGDDYVVNGQKMYNGNQYDNAEYFFLVAVTDPRARRHHNVGLFWVPTNLPGITKTRVPMMRNCHTGGWHVFYENVRVPGKYLLGGHENASNAWRAVVYLGSMPSQIRTQIKGYPVRDYNHEYVLEYARKTECEGQPLNQDPAVREALTEVEIQLEIQRLFNVRQYGREYGTGKRASGYEFQENALQGKKVSWTQSEAYGDVMGPVTLMKNPEDGLFNGNIEYKQHQAIVHAAAGVPSEIYRMLMARFVCRSGD